LFEIGPNLEAILLALVGVLSLVVQSYLAQGHAERVQKNGSDLAKPAIEKVAAAMATKSDKE